MKKWERNPMSPNDAHECVKIEKFTEIEKRLTSNEEKVKTIFTENTKLDQTLEKLDKTQNELTIQLAQLNSAFTTIKYLVGLFIAVFGGIFVFLITELIKII